MQSSLTSIVRELNESHSVPLSTLKLNARILREFNLISYGERRRGANAEILPLGRFVLKLIQEEQGRVTVRYDN
ncbi:MAG: hypothetical protein NTV15_04755 [Candidatus Bathyarchaeota archaeon]|nr:hypothetical protein [Candidatus Bathyarchaeota archaeon]